MFFNFIDSTMPNKIISRKCFFILDFDRIVYVADTTIESPVDLIYNIILIIIRPQIWSEGSEYKGCWNMGENDGEIKTGE